MKKLAISMIVGALALATLAQTADAKSRIVVRNGYSPFYQTIEPYTGDRLAIYRPNYFVPSNDFEGGAYPGAYAINRALGKCVIDLGYGRYEHC